MDKIDDVKSFNISPGAIILMHSRLEAESVHNAWYELALIGINEGYLVEKVSGAAGHAVHSEIWYRHTLKEAEDKFRRIISEKTKPDRRSPRKYHVVSETALKKT